MGAHLAVLVFSLAPPLSRAMPIGRTMASTSHSDKTALFFCNFPLVARHALAANRQCQGYRIVLPVQPHEQDMRTTQVTQYENLKE